MTLALNEAGVQSHPLRPETPYTCPDDHLDELTELVWLLLGRHMAHFGHWIKGEDGFGFDEAMALLQARGRRWAVAKWQGATWPQAGQMAARIAAHRAMMARRLTATASNPSPVLLPVEDLRARFGLEDHEITLLLVASAFELSSDLDHLQAFVCGRERGASPSLGFLIEVAADNPRQARALRRSVSEQGKLVRRGLIRVDGSTGHTLWFRRPATVSDAVLSFISGETGGLSGRVSGFGGFEEGEVEGLDVLELGEGVRARLVRALRRAFLDGRSSVALVGGRGVGRRSALRAYLASLGMGLLRLELAPLLARARRPGEIVRQLGLEATLRGCALLVRCRGVSSTDLEAIASELRQALVDFEGLVVFSEVEAGARCARMLSIKVEEVSFGRLEGLGQRRVWSRLLRLRGCPGAESLAGCLSERLDATPSSIHAAVSEVATCAAFVRASHSARLGVLTRAVLGARTHALGELAEPFEISLGWDDAVFSARLARDLEEVVVRATCRTKVLEEWGFGRLSHRRGLSCLFHGPTGTGKTMAAALIAARLGLPLYRVVLSQFVSKHTVSKLFDEAEAAGAALLFDGADSLFTHIEINHLVQRMAAHEGLTILTADLVQGLDERLRRRLSFRIHFPRPTAAERALLWRRMLPPQARVADGIDFVELASAFDLSGGAIGDAVLRAAFQAAHAGCSITSELLYEAAAREARERDMLTEA